MNSGLVSATAAAVVVVVAVVVCNNPKSSTTVRMCLVSCRSQTVSELNAKPQTPHIHACISVVPAPVANTVDVVPWFGRDDEDDDDDALRRRGNECAVFG